VKTSLQVIAHIEGNKKSAMSQLQLVLKNIDRPVFQLELAGKERGWVFFTEALPCGHQDVGKRRMQKQTGTLDNYKGLKMGIWSIEPSLTQGSEIHSRVFSSPSQACP